MNKFTGAGPYLYATAIAAFAIIQLVTQNFLTGLFPVSPTLPLRWVLMILSSGIFLVAAAGILFHVRPQLAAVVAGWLFLVFFFVLYMPKVLGDLYNGGDWAGAFENLMLASGAFIIASYFPSEMPGNERWTRMVIMANIFSRYGFAVSLLLFGIQHIIYFTYIETLIPVWLPAQAFWATIVTGAFLLSAISFFSGWKIGLASLLLGIMFGLWVIILHAPRAIGKGNVETEWSSLFVALGVCGVALTLARRYLTGPTGRVAVRHAELAGDILSD